MKKNPLLSRKFWVAILTIVLPLIVVKTGVEVDMETALMIVMSILGGITYITTEGKIDRAGKGS